MAIGLRIKKGDKVAVIAGKDKGKDGKVLQVITDRQRVVVEGVNKVKRHMKPNQQNKQGGIVEKEAALHISNVAILDPKSNKPTRIGVKTVEKGKKQHKVRYAKKSGEVLDKV